MNVYLYRTTYNITMMMCSIHDPQNYLFKENRLNNVTKYVLHTHQTNLRTIRNIRNVYSDTINNYEFLSQHLKNIEVKFLGMDGKRFRFYLETA
jgi:hypothetical protein